MLRCCLNSSYAEVLFKSGYAEVFMLSQVRDVTQVSEKCSVHELGVHKFESMNL